MCSQLINRFCFLTYYCSAELNYFLFLLLESANTYANGEIVRGIKRLRTTALAGNLMSQITLDTFLYPFHPACTLLFTSLSQPPLSYTVDPKYLNSFTLGTFVSSIFTISSLFPPFMHRYSVFDLLTFIPLLSNAYLQDSNLRSTSSLVSSQITISSANSIVHGDSLFTSSVSLSIITANRNGLNGDLWCSPTLTFKLSVVPTAHLTTVLLPSYISCTSCTYFSTIPDFFIQYHSSSRGTLS